jgi:hypothetical protein
VHGVEKAYRCRFLFFCTGYCNDDEPYHPTFPGIEQFAGDVVHPQFWPESFDHAGKRIVVIGSGATAVSLIPSLTGKAAHITMLQRTPSYMISATKVEPIANAIRKVLPLKVAHWIARWRNAVVAGGRSGPAVALAVITVVGVFFVGMGVYALAAPAALVRPFGITLDQSTSRSEVRAVYGGFGLAIGGVLAYAALHPSDRVGITLTVGAALAGMAFGRIVSAVVDARTRFYPNWFYCLVEIIAAAALFAIAFS